MKKKVLYLGLDPTFYPSDGEIFHCPMIEIISQPLTDPLLMQTISKFKEYTHVLISSKNAALLLKKALVEFGISMEEWQSKHTIAIGQITAKYLKEEKIHCMTICKEETAEGMIEEIESLSSSISMKTTYFFWPHSKQARPVIEDYLTKRGFRYEACILYQPVARSIALPPLELFEEIIFTSPSIVKAFFSQIKKIPQQIKLTSIGPITMKALEAAITQLR